MAKGKQKQSKRADYTRLVAAGDGHRNQGRLEEAARAYRAALRLKPNAEVFGRLGEVLKALGLVDEAIEAYRESIALNPSANSCVTLGDLLRARAKYAEAEAIYRQGLQLEEREDIYNQLGIALKEQSKLDEAVAAYRTALAMKPSDYAYFNLGGALKRQGDNDGAIAAYQDALKVNPDYHMARFGILTSHLPIVYANQQEIDTHRRAYAAYLREMAAYYESSSQEVRAAAANGAHAQTPFYLPYQGLNDRDLQEAYGDMMVGLMKARYPQWSARPPTHPRDRDGRIRLGFVTGFFRHHSVWKMRLRGWLEHLDREKFLLFGYHTGQKRDANTAYAVNACDKFVQGPLSTDGWAREIAADRLHALIYPEIGMDNVALPLACLRLAPLQMVSWSHPETTGFSTFDYFLSNELMEAENAQEHYTETLVRLPHLGVHYLPTGVEPAPIDRRDWRLDDDEVMYWCCQSLFKYLPQHDDVFPRIAQGAKRCKFAFIRHKESDQSTEVFFSRMKRIFAEFGLDYRDHCILLPRLPSQMFAGGCAVSDVMLDSIGWSGCNTILETLTYDVPVVTWPGDLMRARHGLGILRRIGMEETIAASKDDYVELAVRLGVDRPYRDRISREMAANKHRLYGDLSPIRALENLIVREVEARSSGGAAEPTAG